MKELTVDDAITQYIESGNCRYYAFLKRDMKTCNEEYAKILDVFKYLEKHNDIAEKTLPKLFTHENIDIRSMASVHALALGINAKAAREVLDNIAKDKKNGIFAFYSRIAVEVWQEGKLVIYKEEEI